LGTFDLGVYAAVPVLVQLSSCHPDFQELDSSKGDLLQLAVSKVALLELVELIL
jgi:hypothetical protein